MRQHAGRVTFDFEPQGIRIHRADVDLPTSIFLTQVAAICSVQAQERCKNVRNVQNTAVALKALPFADLDCDIGARLLKLGAQLDF